MPIENEVPSASPGGPRFVQDLPANPVLGESVYLSLGKPGFWSQQTFDGVQWQWAGGIACPYIPDVVQRRYEELARKGLLFEQGDHPN